MMGKREIQRLREQLSRLMQEGIESLKTQTFLGLDPKEVLEQRERLGRIRELSLEYLLELSRNLSLPVQEEDNGQKAKGDTTG